MNFSYAMGMTEEIYNLEKEGFIIEKDGEDFKVSFDKKLADKWETFVYKHLAEEYWNEYITEDEIIFIFHLKNGFKRYVVKNFDNDEVLKLCEEFCDRKFESLEKLIKDNDFYREKFGEKNRRKVNNAKWKEN